MSISETGCPLCSLGSIEEYARLEKARILVCRRCTCGWTYPPPGVVDYETVDFHQSASGEEHTELDDLPDAWKESLYQQASLIKRHLLTGDKILEIGCGQGILLRV